jgi:formimidoylglutamate deiminase
VERPALRATGVGGPAGADAPRHEAARRHASEEGRPSAVLRSLEGRPSVGLPEVVLPGFVNAHSHAFQRVLRGRAEGAGGDFWSWRERMYQVALRLEPEDVRIASRAAFLEMLLAGFTGVIEFHYLHHDPRGRPYADPNALARAVLEAAAEVGIRICLLETAYARAGRGREPDPAQRRFADPSVGVFLERAESLRGLVRASGPLACFGLALHSVRALPREWLSELSAWVSDTGEGAAVAQGGRLPVHMHVAEQAGEVEACLAEHGRRPVELLQELGLLAPRFTAVHAIHLTEEEIGLLARSGAGVCACPSTEGNLGDGFVSAGRFFRAGIPLGLGTDSQASIDPFAEMRELDYRERLQSRDRAGAASAARLLEAATAGGAGRAGWLNAGRGHRQDAGRTEGLDAGRDAGRDPRREAGRTEAQSAPGEFPTGKIANGFAADLVVLDAGQPSLAGADAGSLADHLLVAGSPALVKDVYVAGRRVVREGHHSKQEEILRDFTELQRRLWKSR